MRRDFPAQGKPDAPVCRWCSMGRRRVAGVWLCKVCDDDALTLALVKDNRPKEG